MSRLDKTLSDIEKDLGKGAIMRLGAKQELVEAISTGSITLDRAIGIGGFPRGRIIEIYGPESSGKTTIAIHAIAEAQKTGLVCAIVDAEHAFVTKYARDLGVDTENLLISQPDHGDQGLEIVCRLAESGEVGLIVIDSVAALVPKAEVEGEVGENKMGLQARLMSQALRKLVGVAHKSNCSVIFINQLREKIGVMFGNPETTTGGNSLKFYASVRLDVRRSITAQNSITDADDRKIGNQTTVRVIKNKVAPPFGTAQFDIMYGEGIDKQGELIDLAIEKGVINKGGAWFSYKDVKIQGRDAFRQLLKDNPELFEEIKNIV